MKNKKLMYVLLPAVLAIWGGIFYRIYEAATDSDTEDFPVPAAVHSPKPNHLADTTQLLANYRDPFLEGAAGIFDTHTYGASASHTAVVRVPAPTVVTPSTVVIPPVPWPAVQYKGMIQNGKSATKIALLQLNGKSFMVSEKQAVQEIQVTRIYTDSIGVLFRAEEKYFRR